MSFFQYLSEINIRHSMIITIKSSYFSDFSMGYNHLREHATGGQVDNVVHTIKVSKYLPCQRCRNAYDNLHILRWARGVLE